jgi:hypothetical protein
MVITQASYLSMKTGLKVTNADVFRITAVEAHLNGGHY